jgi:hypothetical protein
MEIELNGLPVKKVYYKGQIPKISNGHYKITNNSKNTATIRVLEIWVTDGENKIPIDEYFVYKLPDYTELDPKNISIRENEEFQLDLSFQFIPDDVGLNKKMIKVNMTIKVDGEIAQASSPVIIEYRIPKNS